MSKNIDISHQVHLVQTKEWNEFKKQYGTRVDNFEDIYFLVKKIPLTNKYMAYAPKVNFLVQKVNFTSLKEYCIKNNIAFVRFDIPNIDKNTKKGKEWDLKLSKLCKKSPRNTFTKSDLYLNIQPDTEELLKGMHQKRRYNIRYAIKKGVKVKISTGSKGLDRFYKTHSDTAKRQKFLTHPKKYFKTIQNTLKDEVSFVEAYYNKKLLVSWFVVVNQSTAYYVYGGSTEKYRNLYPSDLVGFNAIEHAKNKGAKLFDFWGAEEGKGFTDFKRRYGAKTIEYINSYDFVLNGIYHKQFNLMYQSFWKLQEIRKKLSC